MNKKLRVGIIGAGRWGPNVIGALKRIEDVNLQIVADINQTALDLVKSRFSNLSTTTDPMELITDDSLDALAICTPVETHLDFVEKALNNGKNVFVEKPLGKESNLCSKVCDLAESKGLKLVVGHVFLFNNSILSLKEIIQTGDIGDILHLTATRTNLGPVRKDVNAAWDLTSHDLSIFNFLLDSNPLEVSCIGSCKLDSNTDDTTYTSFKYENEIFMCPETHDKKEIRVYKCIDFPTKWEFHKTLMKDVSAADTIIFKHDNRWWLLMNIDQSCVADHDCQLHIFSADNPLSEEWVAHENNPVIFDPLVARNGGLILSDNEIYRVFQRQGFDMYGEACGIAKIIRLSPTEYVEEICSTIEPKFFDNIKGTHTYNFDSDLIVLDYLEIRKKHIGT